MKLNLLLVYSITDLLPSVYFELEKEEAKQTNIYIQTYNVDFLNIALCLC